MYKRQLLHDGNLFDDLLQIRVHRDLLDGQDLAGFLVQGLEHGSITSLAQFTENVKHLLRLASQRLLGEFLQLPEKENGGKQIQRIKFVAQNKIGDGSELCANFYGTAQIFSSASFYPF